MAAAVQYLQENSLLDYSDLEKKADETTTRFHTLSDKIKAAEAAMKRNAELRTALADYAKTRAVFVEYKSKKYSRKYLAEHKAEISAYRAAQATFRRVLDGEKLPKMNTLKTEGQRLAADKKVAYAEYRAARKDMRVAVVTKANIDRLFSLTDRRTNKEMER